MITSYRMLGVVPCHVWVLLCHARGKSKYLTSVTDGESKEKIRKNDVWG